MSEVKKVSLGEFWANWSTNFLNLAGEPMPKELTKVFMACILMEREGDQVPEEIETVFSYQVVVKRAEFVSLTMTPAVAAFIALLSRSPGDAVMWVYALRYALRYAQLRDNLPVIDTEALANLFPMGFPTEAGRHAAWDGQKDGGANMLGRMGKVDLVL